MDRAINPGLLLGCIPGNCGCIRATGFQSIQPSTSQALKTVIAIRPASTYLFWLKNSLHEGSLCYAQDQKSMSPERGTFVCSKLVK